MSQVTEESFNLAFNKAGPYARVRLLRKLNKIRYRNENGRFDVSRPCKDLEQYVENFVAVHGAKK